MPARESRPARLPRWIRAVLLVLVASMLSGCLAPSYIGVDKPYNEADDTIYKSYQATYDGFVLLQLYPVPLCDYLDTRWGETGHTIIMSCAMPIAAIGSAVFGTILSPIAILLPEDWINWEAFKR